MDDAACLIIIDVQKGIFTLKQPVFKTTELLGKLKQVIQVARRKKMAIFYTQHENVSFLKKGSTGWEMMEVVMPASDERVITKKHPSVFKETGLLQILKQAAVRRLVVAGVVSNGCVRESCLEAIANGFNVTLISDGHSTFYKNAAKIILNINGELEERGVALVSSREFGG